MSIQAYQRNATRVESPREIEYRVFGLVTAALVRARDAGPHQLGKLAEALNDNRRLWTELAIDCASPANKLPNALRAQIISLGIFVEKYTPQALSSGDIDPLIDINRLIMEGLAG
jgi:flagellar protein FlaF